GPDPTPAHRCASLPAELGEQSLALPLTEPAQPTAGGDLELLHGRLGADLTDTRQGLEQRRDLHLAENLVVVGLLEHVGQGGATSLQPLLELRPSPASRSSLLQGSGALFLGQLGKCHDVLRIDYGRFVAATLPTRDRPPQRGVSIFGFRLRRAGRICRGWRLYQHKSPRVTTIP